MSGVVPAGRTWIVLLEAADVAGGSTIGPGDFRRLVVSWAAPTAKPSTARTATHCSCQ